MEAVANLLTEQINDSEFYEPAPKRQHVGPFVSNYYIKQLCFPLWYPRINTQDGRKRLKELADLQAYVSEEEVEKCSDESDEANNNDDGND